MLSENDFINQLLTELTREFLSTIFYCVSFFLSVINHERKISELL